MEFIREYGFCVKVGRDEEFQRWLTDHEAELGASYPDGVQYLGTYSAIFTTNKHGGDYPVLEMHDSYAAGDRLAATMKGDNEYSRLIREVSTFIDPKRTEDWSNELFKAVVDATIWDLTED